MPFLTLLERGHRTQEGHRYVGPALPRPRSRQGECFINTTDPGRIFSGSDRCSAAAVATLSLDVTFDSFGALLPNP